VSAHDPIANPNDARDELRVNLSEWDRLPSNADAIVLAVPHQEYLNRDTSILFQNLRPNGVLVDIKGVAYNAAIKGYWSL
jgi:UDP-N-acetyl-D-galactosamine dehydrogenase